MRFLAAGVLASLLSLLLLPLLPRCSSPAPAPAEPPCVQGLSAACQAQDDPPTYATVFGKILKPSCATGRGTCHTADGAKAGLVMESGR